MTRDDEKYIFISNQTDLNKLIDKINWSEKLSGKFKFTERKDFIYLLESIGIDYKEFCKKYYHYDKERHLHISESEFEYIWISTYGLIAGDKASNNKAVNACINQYTTLSLLLDKAIEISKSEKVYDVDWYNFGLLAELSPALFHNLIFYVELFCKAYLSLSGVDNQNGHKLSILYERLITTMHKNNHNNSLFHVYVADKFAKIIDYIRKIPGNFKEQYIKYDDNPEDTTVIIFDPENLNEIKMMIDLCDDFILDFSHKDSWNGNYLTKSGLYERMLEQAETEDQKNKISKIYKHLIPAEE